MTDTIVGQADISQPGPAVPDLAVETHQYEPSLRGRLAARRQRLHEDRSFLLPVPGYEHDLVARYKPLDYVVLRKIGERQKEEPNEFLAEIYLAADTLANSCQGIFTVGKDGQPDEQIAQRWSTQVAQEWFDVGPDELPPGSGARAAIMAIFPDHTSIVLHFSRYSELANDASAQIDDVVRGESVASTEV